MEDLMDRLAMADKLVRMAEDLERTAAIVREPEIGVKVFKVFPMGQEIHLKVDGPDKFQFRLVDIWMYANGLKYRAGWEKTKSASGRWVVYNESE